MRLQIENVGKVKEANVEINGITVIAGENNTGKSTIGKMLFCLFDTFYDIENKVRNERISSVAENMRIFVKELLPELRGNAKAAYGIELAAEQFIGTQKVLIDEMKKQIGVIILCSGSDPTDPQFFLNDKEYENLVEKVNNVLQIPDETIRKYILQRHLVAEFGGQVANVNLDEEAKVSLKIKDKEIAFTSNGSVAIEKYVDIVKRIVYIDNPFVLDELVRGNSLYHIKSHEHASGLVNLLRKTTSSGTGIIDEIVADQKTANILSAINKVSDGDLQREEGHWFYKSKKFRSLLEVQNLSTGIKSFTIIKTLLKNGMLEENGIMVLDEPEIHLHPEWQLKYAEVIALLHKEFGINILLNTHSPYFLWAIENAVKKYSIADKYKLYSTEAQGDTSILTDMTEKSEVVYKKMYNPLQELENEEYRYE